jgi:putative tryptophan/tyrosine transport system substrate-binding protein
MRRREFLGIVGGTPLAWPLAARAQQHKMLRIGTASANPRNFSTWVAFEQRLHELGYVDGRNLTFEFIHLGKNLGRSNAAMRELVDRKVDMIVDGGEQATLQAAMSATRTLPIIMFAVTFDPVAAGYVASLPRPGGNVTGVFLRRPELIEKQLEVLAEAFPGRRRLAVLWDDEYSFRAVEQVAQKFPFDVQSFRLEHPPYDFIATFVKLAEDKSAIVFVLSSVLFNEHAQEIAQLAIRHALPTMFTSRRYVDAGGLLAYGPNIHDMFRLAADYVDRIARGSKPADLPIEQPTKFELVLNLKTAKIIGVTVPTTTLLRATEVIE